MNARPIYLLNFWIFFCHWSCSPALHSYFFDAEDSSDSRPSDVSIHPPVHESSQNRRREPASVDPLISSARYSTLKPEIKREYHHGSRATRDDFMASISTDEGSLWASNGQVNYYLTKNKSHHFGDLIDLTIEAELYRDLVLAMKRNLTLKEKETYFLQSQKKARDLISASAAQKKGLGSAHAVDPVATATPVPDGAAPMSSLVSFKEGWADMDLAPFLELKLGDVIKGIIIERFANGDCKIRCSKKIFLKYGSPRIIQIIGIIKSADLNDGGESLASGKLYEYQVDIGF